MLTPSQSANRVSEAIGQRLRVAMSSSHDIPARSTTAKQQYAPGDDVKRGILIFENSDMIRAVVGVGGMKSLVPEAFYWARSDRHTDGKTTIVQVSSIFGEDPDYWTIAVPGSDQHCMISDFEIIALVEPLDGYPLQHAAE